MVLGQQSCIWICQESARVGDDYSKVVSLTRSTSSTLGRPGISTKGKRTLGLVPIGGIFCGS
jgi:hypothetical protein